MSDAESADQLARIRRLEGVVEVLVDAFEKIAPHLPVLISMEAGAMADEARRLLDPDAIDLTSADD